MNCCKGASAPHGGKQIDMTERFEVHYWCEKFGVSPDQLHDAVEAAGPMAEAVERRLKDLASSQNFG